jgi:hypothetical protein
MKVTNQLARDIVAEVRSSIDDKRFTDDVITSFINQDGTKGAQIVAECLQRVMPNITADGHVQAVTDERDRAARTNLAPSKTTRRY